MVTESLTFDPDHLLLLARTGSNLEKNQFIIRFVQKYPEILDQMIHRARAF